MPEDFTFMGEPKFPPRPPEKCSHDGCTNTSYQRAEVRVPIEVKPDVDVKDIEVECCGEPDVKCREEKCKKTVEILVTQKINIKIPITYKISACAKESELSCGHDTACCNP